MASPIPAPGKITETDTVTISGAPGLIDLFQKEARTRYGAKGVSRAGREAFEEWLTKRGVKLNGEGFDLQTVQFMEACRAAVARGVDPLVALAAAVNLKAEEEASTPLLAGIGR